jgi:hypothetical protein
MDGRVNFRKGESSFKEIKLKFVDAKVVSSSKYKTKKLRIQFAAFLFIQYALQAFYSLLQAFFRRLDNHQFDFSA